MNWTLDQLEAFITAVECGSFSGAARKLGKAQSRISTAIANLEADLNLVLFDRSARLPVLTPAGEGLIDEAHAILAQCRRLEAKAMSAVNDEEIELVIATDEAVPLMAFHRLCADLSMQFPLLKLTIINGSRDDISNLVQSGKAQIGVLFHSGRLDDSLEFYPIGRFEQTLIVSPTHTLANIPAPTLAELAPFRQLVICDKRGEGRDQPLTANHWYIDSYFYMTELVIAGLGWALIPDHVANSDWYRSDLVRLSTQHIHGKMQVEVGLVKRADHGPGIVLTWLMARITQVFR